MAKKLILFIVTFSVWAMLTWPMDGQHALVGVFVAMVATLLTADMFIQKVHFFTHGKRYVWFVYYLIIFAWECFKANIDVAYRVMHPDMPINPGIVKVKTSLKSDTGLTFLANSITLTPGTLSVDVDKNAGCLYIHWIDVKNKDIKGATEIIVKKFERILAEIFE
ncbi:Na+/H+ antiporter subunit E [Candidatus Omnitrophota bacterium]